MYMIQSSSAIKRCLLNFSIGFVFCDYLQHSAWVRPKFYLEVCKHVQSMDGTRIAVEAIFCVILTYLKFFTL